MTTSRIPAVTTALLALVTTALPTATLVQGPRVNAPDVGEEWVSVGASPNSEVGVTASQDWAALGRLSRQEDVDLVCYLEVSTGDPDNTSITTAFNRAWAMFAAIESAVRADPTFGGAVPSGWLAPVTYTGYPQQDATGYAYGIEFHISGTGRI